MNFRLITALITLSIQFVSLNIFAANKSSTVFWEELEIAQKYTLQQKICFDETHCLQKGEPFIVDDIIPGSGLPMMVYKIKPYTCFAPEFQSEQILIEPENSDHQIDRSVIVQQDAECDIWIWVETADYYSDSFFARPSFTK